MWFGPGQTDVRERFFLQRLRKELYWQSANQTIQILNNMYCFMSITLNENKYYDSLCSWLSCMFSDTLMSLQVCFQGERSLQKYCMIISLQALLLGLVETSFKHLLCLDQSQKMAGWKPSTMRLQNPTLVKANRTFKWYRKSREMQDQSENLIWYIIMRQSDDEYFLIYRQTTSWSFFHSWRHIW